MFNLSWLMVLLSTILISSCVPYHMIDAEKDKLSTDDVKACLILCDGNVRSYTPATGKCVCNLIGRRNK